MTDFADLLAGLAPSLAAEAEREPGERAARQPVHTVYGGAHLFRAGTARRLGELALAALDAHAPTPADLAAALGPPLAGDDDLAARVHARVIEKLRREPVEDLRIDFEDGYGNRPDDEEDGHAESAARELARGAGEGSLPPFVGIRIKPLTSELGARSLRTLGRFLAVLGEGGGGRLPDGFVVTLPKVTLPEQVETLVAALARLEEELGLGAGAVPIELMVETPRSILAADGRAALPGLVSAAAGRCRGAHLGTYDYTASLGITAAHQRMDHPACDLAKQVMQVALAGTGVWLSDGATNVLPVAPHRGDGLTDAQRAENRRVVHAAWRLHAAHVTHSLVGAFYQGWDLHPAQLPSRYAAVYAFFLAGAAAAGERLRTFVEGAARATLSGDVFDDAATGQGLLNFFLRATSCGALSGEEARRLSGLSDEELASRSFLRILAGRRRAAG
ncbi:MAG TPA: aldolase/citrate lyase family protein [Thermoanaerobaculia bacterium]|nr:aldolase/citrate lyase family protein [Thermoanaerobaculia bacterium]